VAETSSASVDPPTAIPDEGVDLQKKKEDEIKKIDIT
jgi:hypothetical protein